MSKSIYRVACSGMILTFALALGLFLGCGGSKQVAQETAPAEQAPPEPQPEPAPPPPPPPEPEPAAPAPLVLSRVHFDYDKYDLTPTARETLAQNAQGLQNHPAASVVVEGHCDERGTIEYNLALGDKRARAVKDYLASLGVNASQLSTISYGKERPVDPGHGEEAWAQNRRAEFVIQSQ